MHPAFSIIFFTAAAGAGYGLLAMLGILAACGLLPPDRTLGVISLCLALALIVGGLLSSTLHLGRPERAWRAFSQWRSSWLSREGIASVFTFVPTGLFGLGWLLLGRTDGIVAVSGFVMTAAAAITVFSTGMIYACLKPIAQWNTHFTAPGYLIFAFMTGSVLLDAILALMNLPDRRPQYVALIAIGVGWIWKRATWRHNDRLASPATLNSATGLGAGEVRSVEWPHTEENYLLKEMGYRVARKHAARLRLLAQLFAFGLPLVATALAAASGGGIARVAGVLAALAQAPGILVERWLFFAEASHTVRLYYGLKPAGRA
ncbi:MAG TPA: DmsC/YnfH family molybdoenzyme membrane anchor subunit [Reyranella sp.]|nr:DmsC/YnfH family molybdoenzyme membrane anchor subunit [Reyranella sp.]